MAGQAHSELSRIRHPRYWLFAGLFAVTLIPLLLVLRVPEAIVGAFDIAAAGFVLSCVPLWVAGGPEIIRQQAQRDDAGQLFLLLLTGLICAVVFVATVELKAESARHGALGIALIVFTLIASWTFANLICALHYARLFYSPDDSGDHEGLLFPGKAAPDFADFVNFAFVIGMACQTADVSITSTRIRRVSTFHGLFAFAFNLGILALSVNILAAQS